MKKYVSAALAMLVIAYALFTAGCGENEESKSTHTDPEFLVGTWARTATENLPIFTISSDMSFECDVLINDELGLAKVKGSLDHNGEGLGPNDYIIRNMQTVDAGPEYTAGNNTLSAQLWGFQDLFVTMAPNGGKTEFDFSSRNVAARMFFGGIYTKQL